MFCNHLLKTLIYDERTIQRETQIKKHRISESLLVESSSYLFKLKEIEIVIKMTKGYMASDFSLLPNDTIQDGLSDRSSSRLSGPGPGRRRSAHKGEIKASSSPGASRARW